MITFKEYLQKKEALELPIKAVGGLVSGGAGAGLGFLNNLRKGKNPLIGALKGAKNFALSTWTDGEHGEHDDQGNPKFMRK